LPWRRAPATYPSRWQALQLKRARKQGIRLADGSIIAFPYMPRVADLPPGWRHFTTAQKIEHLIGLDRCDEICPGGLSQSLDPLRLSFQMQAMRILLRIGVKAVLDGHARPRSCSRARPGAPPRRTFARAPQGTRRARRIASLGEDRPQAAVGAENCNNGAG